MQLSRNYAKQSLRSVSFHSVRRLSRMSRIRKYTGAMAHGHSYFDILFLNVMFARLCRPKCYNYRCIFNRWMKTVTGMMRPSRLTARSPRRRRSSAEVKCSASAQRAAIRVNDERREPVAEYRRESVLDHDRSAPVVRNCFNRQW